MIKIGVIGAGKWGLNHLRVFSELGCTLVGLADTNEKVRNIAIKAIRERFINKALTPMKWAIEYESNYYCIININ